MVVCPESAAFRLPAESARAFGRTQVVEQVLVPLGEARAAGIRLAQSPLVVIAETHAFPARDWAEHLVGAHAEGWNAVIPAVENANAGSALSWSAYVVDYGRWAPNGGSGEIGDPPSYHASFERDTLVAFGPRLGVLL
ncbi:hypothetical protein BH09ACT13_BH09ACT13_06230 [soil metagenome]